MSASSNRSAIVMILSIGLSSAVAFSQNIRLSPDDSLEAVIAKAADVRPTPRQIAWQRDEISAFIHFGMNTFTDREWGDGKEDEKLFNPTDLDARQWVAAAKAAGITRMILTAKHHDGFCLWPSKYTEHCVRNSPWKNGHGDVVGEFIAACRAEGMHYGIYISPWDRHEKTYGDSPRYNQHFLDQLREVLTNYPGIEEVWFDGACGEGPNGKQQVYDWRAYWKLIRELAPNACITVRGPDVRWCGNEAGFTRNSEWSVIPMPGDDQPWEFSDKTLSGFLHDIHGDDLGSRDALMRSRTDHPVLAWYPSQVNTSIRPGWFYHKYEDGRVRSLKELLTIYYGSVGGNGQFLLNIPPDRRGLFHENDVARLKEFGDFLKATFSQNLAAGAKLSAEVTDGKPVGDLGALAGRKSRYALDHDRRTGLGDGHRGASRSGARQLPDAPGAHRLRAAGGGVRCGRLRGRPVASGRQRHRHRQQASGPLCRCDRFQAPRPLHAIPRPADARRNGALSCAAIALRPDYRPRWQRHGDVQSS